MLWDTRKMTGLLDPSLFHESQLEEIKSCFKIGLACVDSNYKKRPTIDGVVRKLDKIKQNAGTPENPSSMLRRLNTLTSMGRRHALMWIFCVYLEPNLPYNAALGTHHT